MRDEQDPKRVQRRAEPLLPESGRKGATILLRKRKRSSLNPMHALTIVFRRRANPSSARHSEDTVEPTD
jgi:hypothetical protein